MKYVMKYRKRRLLKALAKAQDLYNSDKYVKAICVYGRILDMIDETETHRRVSVLEKIGDMYIELELYSDAREVYAEAVAIEPNSASLRFSLAICHNQLKEPDAAKEQFAHAYWLVADKPAELRRGAAYLEGNGMAGLALNWTERAEKLESKTSWREE